MAKAPPTKQPTKADLLQRITELEASYTPQQIVTVNDYRNEMPSTLMAMNADRVHAAIQNAEQGTTWELFSMYRDALIADSHLQGLINTRFLSVLGDDPMISPVNPDKPEDVAAAEAIKAAVDRLPDFMGLCADLLWGAIWPLAMVERTYKPAEVPGLVYDWADIVPVPDYLFRWSMGYLEVGEINPQSRKPDGKFLRPDAGRYITHRGHLLKTPDNWGGPMRSLLWWFFFKVMDREWWARFLDKYGTPFTVAKFEKNDNRSRQILEQALRMSTKIGGLVVTTGTQVELLKAGTGDTAGSYQAFWNACNDEQSRLVLGQTLSSTASPTGLGSGASGLQGQVRDDITTFDKKLLAQTLRTQFFKPWLRLNHFTGAVPSLTFGGEVAEENEVTARVLKDFSAAGLRVADKSLPALSKRVNLEIERAPAPAPMPAGPGAGVKTLSAMPTVSDAGNAADSISREAAASLARVYRGTLAPVRQIVLESATPAECEAKLLACFVDWSPERAAEVVETAVVAGAWNGTQV